MLLSFLSLLVALVVQDSAQDEESLWYLGHPSRLRIVGTEVIPAEDVHEALTTCKGFLRASDPYNTKRAYRSWLQQATTIAYHHAGFADVVVEVRFSAEEGVTKVEVDEGPRLLAGEVRFENVELLDREWVRAVLRAGQAAPICHEHLAAPPGPEPTYSQLLENTAEKERTFWVPGEGARHSLEDRERFEQLVVEAATMAGLRALRSSVRWERLESNILVPIVVVDDEGSVAVVRAVRFEGDFTDPIDPLLEWVSIPGGTPATAPVRLEAVQRLVTTGRFGKVDGRYEAMGESETEYDLVLELEQAPVVPSLGEHPAGDLALMRRAVQRLEEGTSPQAGIDAEVFLSPQYSRTVAMGLGSVGLPAALEEGDRFVLRLTLLRSFVAFELGRVSTDETSSPLVRFVFDDRGGVLHVPPLELRMSLPAAEMTFFPLISADYARSDTPDGKDFKFGINFGYDWNPVDDQPPVVVRQRITPSALLYLHGYLDAPDIVDPAQLVRTRSGEWGTVRATVDREEARLLLEAELETMGNRGRIRYGELVDVSPPAWAAPLESEEVGRGSMIVTPALATMEVVRAFVANADPDSVWAKSELLLVVAGVHALAAEAGNSPREEEPEERVPFVVHDLPRVPDEAAAVGFIGHMLEVLALQVVERHGTWTWPSALARAMPALAPPSSREDVERARDMIELVSRDPYRGPLGTWMAAWLCDWAGYSAWAGVLAERGLDDLSTDAFLVDCDTLVGLGAGSLKPVTGAWRELRSQATGESAEERMFRETFEGLTEEDPDEAWLRAGLVRLWEGCLRDLVEERLISFENGGEGD